MSHNARNREHRFETVAQDVLDAEGRRIGGLLKMTTGEEFYWWVGPSWSPNSAINSGLAASLVEAQGAITTAMEAPGYIAAEEKHAKRSV